MRSKIRSLGVPRNPAGVLILLAAFAAVAGCSTANSPGGESHIDASGKSVAGWVVVPTGGTHSGAATQEYIAGNGSFSCTQCHGADLSGGISAASCFGNPAGCHHDPVPNWATPAVHGAAAKKAPGSSGFASCQICHGNNFAGTAGAPTCLNNATCHGAVVASPHAPKQWRGSPYTHTTTDTANAPVCAQCHYAGSTNNPAGHPATPAPAGTAPGCFNNTLCHGENPVPHPVRSAWVATSPAAQPHGNSAKATPGAGAGYAYCQACHGTGTDFAGGSSGVSCYPCHLPTANSPHASQWRTGDTYVHTSTAPGNAPVCAYCHLNGNNSPLPTPPAPAPGAQPDCFNNTLCHGAGGAPHPVPYNDGSHFTTTSVTFAGSCTACHDVSAPTVKAGPACRTCHVADSPLAAANCTSCHNSPPDGASPAGGVYPNIAGAHAAHLALNSAGSTVSCDTCHNGLGPSLQNLNHYNAAKSRVQPGDVAFLATYNAKTGASSFLPNALSCTNVSCHGGTSPNWQNSVINVNTQCTICHAQGTTQYNSYNSGEHNRHSGGSFACTECHDMNVATNNKPGVANHFLFLGTSDMEGPARDTFRNSTGSVVYTPGGTPGTGTCTGTCHSKNHSTESW